MQKLYNTISLIAIIVLFIIVFAQGGCGGANKDRGSAISRDTITQIDTIVRLERLRDTFWTHDTFYITKVVESVPEVISVTPNGDSTRVYSGTYGDSSVNVNYTATVEGYLNDLKLSYNLLKPTLITEVVTRDIIKTNNITEKRYMHGFYIGGSGNYNLVNDNLSFSVGGLLTTPKGMAYSYDYDLINKQHSIGVKLRLLPIRKNVR